MIDTAEILRQLEARGPGPCKRCDDRGDVVIKLLENFRHATQPCPVCGWIAKRAVGLLKEALRREKILMDAMVKIADLPVDYRGVATLAKAAIAVAVEGR